MSAPVSSIVSGVALAAALGMTGATRVQADATLDAAQVHLDRGIAAFDAHDYVTARHELSEARELAPDKPNPYRWLALTEVQLGDCPAALGDIDGFLTRVAADDRRRDELIRLRELCESRLRHKPDTTPPPPSQAAHHPPHHTPITHRWWFWTAIGGVALAAGGVAIFEATRDEPMTLLPAIHCDATGCHP